MEKLYLQKLMYSGGVTTKGAVKETVADFNIYIESVGVILLGSEMKDPPKREWNDEDGIDVFYGAKPPMKDYDLEINCMAKENTITDLRKAMTAFLSYLSGGDGSGNVFAIYDTYNSTGRRNVRFTGASPDVYYNLETDKEKFVKFKFKMHVDDPRTEVSLSYDKNDPSKLIELAYEVDDIQ